MPTASGGIFVDPNGSTAVVQITTPSGVMIPMFSDVNCTNSVVMPATITVRTAFYAQAAEPAANVSVKVGGTEFAAPGNKQFQTSFQFGSMDGITLPDPSVIITAPTGTYAPAAASKTAYKSGFYTQPMGIWSTLTPNEGDLHLTELVIGATVSIDRLAVVVTGAGSVGAVMRLGIYNSDAGCVPSSLLLDAGTVACTSTGAQTITVAQTLAPGVYWLAGVCQGGAATRPTVNSIGNYTTGHMVLNQPPLQFNQGGYLRSTVSGAFPDPFGSSTSIGGPLMVFARYV